MTAPARRRLRETWLLFLAGPVIWFVHFMAVYLLAEATCAAGGTGWRLGDVPLVSVATLVTTGIAIAAVLLLAAAAYRRWRTATSDTSDWLGGDDGNPGLALAGALLGVVFVIAIAFVGMPAAVLDPC